MAAALMHRRSFLQALAGTAASLTLPGLAGGARAQTPVVGSSLAAGRPSATAQGAALLRAAHQLLDDPRVFPDPFALRMIGDEAEAALRSDPGRYANRSSLRAFIALRSRYAEDQLEDAVARGVEQYVVLGAGLDTFAYRNAYPALRVFEVDHPATQRWKRQRTREAGLRVPRALRFAPVDFETETLSDGLARAGFAPHEPALFSMLGVAIYLTKHALAQTLSFVTACSPGSEIVFDYSVPSLFLTHSQRLARETAAKRAAAVGEPWLSYFEPAALAAELADLGFSVVGDLGPTEANERYFANRRDGLRVTGSARMMAARV
jgi:methyltransferase (TIGR00027 family)